MRLCSLTKIETRISDFRLVTLLTFYCGPLLCSFPVELLLIEMRKEKVGLYGILTVIKGSFRYSVAYSVSHLALCWL